MRLSVFILVDCFDWAKDEELEVLLADLGDDDVKFVVLLVDSVAFPCLFVETLTNDIFFTLSLF